MKTRFWAFVLAAMMLATVFCGSFGGSVVAETQGSITVRLCYERADGEYADWTVWMWPAGGDGKSYNLEEEDGRMVATAEFSAGTERVGYIVRRGNWLEKDIEKDQFIDVSGITGGVVNAYVKSRVEGAAIDFEDVVRGVAVKSARADGDVVVVEMTGELPNVLTKSSVGIGPFEVMDASGRKLEITDLYFFWSEGIVRVMLDEKLDLNNQYILKFEGAEYKVIMPNVFSTDAFEAEYTYDGDDLGATWSAEKTTFRVWAPTAKSVTVNLYESGDASADDLLEALGMAEDVNGTWIAEMAEDLNGVYYTYSIEVAGATNEACDPYARAVGVNGDRAMVIDLSSTNPAGWEADGNPNAGMSVADMVVYELHVRDFSYDESSGMENKGKYLAFTETGTTNSSGQPTGIDYLKDLGITHLHLLPVFDFGSIDESKPETDQFNWGYDPKNYNTPEGSYATDPFDGAVRVNEFKRMVQSLHNNGVSVVMDVVYNHTYNTNFCFNKIVQGYFYRIDENGVYSSGSGCGNDVATERAMVRKFIVDSILYWVNEYHIDGFRFDLVGLIDIDTMNEVRAEVNKIDPSILIYGEGWTMNTAVTKPGVTLATQPNSAKTEGIAYFSDNIRDAIKGSVFNATEKGYVNGSNARIEEIKRGIHGLPSWAKNPEQVVNYTSCHDNLTLWDKIASSNPKDSVEDRIKQNNLAAAIVFTSQGIPFIHAGEELLRTKLNDDGTFNGNSYASSSALNSIKWDDLNDDRYQRVHDYYRGLIKLRKSFEAFRMTSAEETTSRIEILTGTEPGVIAYTIDGGTSDAMLVVYNPNRESTEITLPEGEWHVYANGLQAGNEVIDIVSGFVAVSPISCMVLSKLER